MQAAEKTKESKKARILRAAEELLHEAGYEALSARAVAERAGVNKALVFYHWGSTSALFEHVLVRYYERHKASLEEAFEEPGTPRERMHRVLDEYLDFMESEQAYARIVQQQVSSQGEHAPLVRAHLSSVLDITKRMMAGITPDKGPLSARHFHLSLSAMVINYFTYSPMLVAEGSDFDPLSAEALAERRSHVHWVVDTWLDALERPSRSPAIS